MLTGSPVSAQLSDTPWSVLQHDPQHTGQATMLGPDFTNLPLDANGIPVLSPTTNPTIVKRWLGPDKIKMSPVLGPEGTLYVGMGFSFVSINPDTMLANWPLSTTGSIKTNLAADVSASAAVIGQTPATVTNCSFPYTLYLGDRDNSISAFCPDGTLRWRYNISHEGDIHTSPVIDDNGTIYLVHGAVGGLQGVVTAIRENPQDPKGWSCVWRSVLGNTVYSSSPTLSTDQSRVYIGESKGKLHAFRTDPNPNNPPQIIIPGAANCPAGEELPGWPATVGNKITNSSPVISPNGKIYVGTDVGLVEVDPQIPSQQRIFKTAIASSATATLPPQVGLVDNTAAITSDGSIIYASAKISKFKAIFAFRPSQCPASPCLPSWEYDYITGADVSAFPVIGADGTLYVGMDRQLAAFPPGGSSTPLWYMPTGNAIISYPALGGTADPETGGTAILYIGSQDRYMYKISSSRGPTGSSQTNHQPTANAGVDNSANTGIPVNFSGSASDIDAGQQLTFNWNFGDGSSPATGTVPANGLINIAHTYTTPGFYTTTLTVTDNGQPPLTATDTSISTINPSDSCSTFDDAFTRVDSPTLGNGWIETANASLSISNGQLANASSGTSIAYPACIFGLNQTVEADFTSVDNNPNPRFGIILRMQSPQNGSPQSYYWLYRIAGGTSALRISKVVNGTETILKNVSISQPALNSPFHLKGQVAGSTLTVLIGATQTSITDTTFASGYAGISLGSSSTKSYKVDNFHATLP